jgi:hypothetical protein
MFATYPSLTLETSTHLSRRLLVNFEMHSREPESSSNFVPLFAKVEYLRSSLSLGYLEVR